MQTLVSQLGLDWKLLLSQVVNFVILLAALSYLVYKPLLKLLAERREKIEQGLEKAKEADRRLAEVADVEKERLKETEKKGIAIILQAETRGKEEERKILHEAAAKESDILKRAEIRAENAAEAAKRQVEQEAAHLVKKILIERVRLKPEAVDEALIEKVARLTRPDKNGGQSRHAHEAI